MSSLADETPEGRSIVVLAKGFGIREHDFAGHEPTFVPFTAADADERRRLQRHPPAQGRRRRDRSLGRRARAAGRRPSCAAQLDRIGREGGTPLAVARNERVLGVIYLKDVVKEGMRARFDQLRAMGIRTIMVTGDNKLTAAKIAEEAGVDDFLAEATPERKLELIREQQADGRLIAMTGDGTNDAPALAQADVGVAMNTGTQAAREAGNMVDLDSNPTKLIEIVEVGKQLLITRGALTTFSIANDVAKYFAILPAMFAATYAVGGGSGPLDALNVMSLGTPRIGDPLGGDLQRADHPAADPALPARRPLPADRRHRPAAPQHADLRPRRPDRPLHRDQGDRPDRPQPAGGLSREAPTMSTAAATRSSSAWQPGWARPTGCCRRATPRRTAGRDVAIGYLEPHEREETTAQARGLEMRAAPRGWRSATSRSRRWTCRRCSPAPRSWR